MVKSVSSSEILKNFGFLPKLLFYHFLENFNFLESYRVRLKDHVWFCKENKKKSKNKINIIYFNSFIYSLHK